MTKFTDDAVKFLEIRVCLKKTYYKFITFVYQMSRFLVDLKENLFVVAVIKAFPCKEKKHRLAAAVAFS